MFFTIFYVYHKLDFNNSENVLQIIMSQLKRSEFYYARYFQ